MHCHIGYRRPRGNGSPPTRCWQSRLDLNASWHQLPRREDLPAAEERVRRHVEQTGGGRRRVLLRRGRGRLKGGARAQWAARERAAGTLLAERGGAEAAAPQPPAVFVVLLVRGLDLGGDADPLPARRRRRRV